MGIIDHKKPLGATKVTKAVAQMSGLLTSLG
jgi:hypothetical protein